MIRTAPLAVVALALLASLWSLPAFAHKPSDSYLRAATSEGGVALQWDVSLRDLHFLVGLDADGDSAITWAEVKAKRSEIAAATLSRLQVEADGSPVLLDLRDLLITDHSDGAHAVLDIGTDAPPDTRALRITYRLLFDEDPTHRGLVFVRRPTGDSAPVILSPESNVAELLLLEDGPGALARFGTYVAEGVHHIWIGFDHILFLLTLLLPAVLVRREKHWEPSTSLGSSLRRVLAVVTAFTLAHSITLWLATTGWAAPPSFLVEAAIAASIVVCAVHNLAPRIDLHGAVIAFGFGLLHGFGFALVLGDLGLGGGSLAIALLGFNIGVELGQLAIVAAFFPVAWGLRRTGFYRVGVLQCGSVLAAVLAAVWMVERLFDLEILGF